MDAVVSLDEGVVDDSLRTGLNAKAEIVTQTAEDVLLVPYECLVQNEQGEDCVYVYRENGVAERQPIEVADEYADGVLVVSGISAGERVVQTPEALSGARVRVRAG